MTLPDIDSPQGIRAGRADLPLRSRTPDVWAQQVLSDANALLHDHAQLEKKAALNALDMLNRWPEPEPPEFWVEKMTAIARDEVEHLALVTKLLARRGGRFNKYHRNAYALGLREFVRVGKGLRELMDRLMVSALIEARSCERFEVLSRCADDAELRRIYHGLWASEHGHYRIFIQLAEQLPKQTREVSKRWDEWLEFEADLLSKQKPGPRMHSGVA